MKQPSKVRKVWGSTVRILLALLTVLICAIAIAYARTDLYPAAGDYEKYRQAASEVGLFSSIDEIQPLYAVSEQDNGAQFMLQAKIPDSYTVGKMTSEQFRRSLNAIEPQIRTLEEAAKRKRIVFQHNKSEPTLFGSDDFNIKGWIKTLTEYIRTGIRIGDAPATARLLKLAAELASHCDEDKTEVALLTRLSSAQVIEAHIRDIVETRGRDPIWLAIADQGVAELDKPYDFRLALKLQHFADVDFINQLERDPLTLHEALNTKDLPAPVRFSKFLPKFYKASLSRIHERYSETFRKLPQDPYDFAGAQAACQVGDDILHRRGWSLSGLQTVDIEFTQFLTAIKKETAIRNALMQSIAILKAKANPAKGLPLSGRHAVDFDGKPIRVAKASDGWTVYTVWQDGMDDGGKVIVDGRGDWAIRLPK